MSKSMNKASAPMFMGPALTTALPFSLWDSCFQAMIRRITFQIWGPRSSNQIMGSRQLSLEYELLLMRGLKQPLGNTPPSHPQSVDSGTGMHGVMGCSGSSLLYSGHCPHGVPAGCSVKEKHNGGQVEGYWMFKDVLIKVYLASHILLVSGVQHRD